MTSLRANVSRLGQFPERGPASPERSGGRFVLPWRAICLIAFWSTLASTLAAVAWLSLIPRQYSFDTGGARQIWRLGTRAYEAQFPGRLPAGCLAGFGLMPSEESFAGRRRRMQRARTDRFLWRSSWSTGHPRLRSEKKSGYFRSRQSSLRASAWP